MRICSNCGAPLDADALFCSECGTKVEIQEGRKCPSCGAPLDGDSAFCTECGCKVEDVPQVQPIAETIEEDVTTKNSTDDILPAPKKDNKPWLYAAGTVIAVMFLALGGKLLYQKVFSNQVDDFGFTPFEKMVRINVPVANLRTAPSADAPFATTDGGSQWQLEAGQEALIVEEQGDWYKIIPFGEKYQEVYISKSVCEEVPYAPIADIPKTYTMLTAGEHGCAYLVYRGDGNHFVLRHFISFGGQEYVDLGQYQKGLYVFYYRHPISSDLWAQYRHSTIVEMEEVNLIDLKAIPETDILQLFKEDIKDKKRSLYIVWNDFLESIWVETDISEWGTDSGENSEDANDFEMEDAIQETQNDVEGCPDDSHPHVIDLGLPSSTKWYCCNYGASTPQEEGALIDYNEVAGNKNLPTSDQANELVDHCSFKKENDGILVTGPNKKRIFFPNNHIWIPSWYEGETGRVEHSAPLLWTRTGESPWFDVYEPGERINGTAGNQVKYAARYVSR